MPKSWPKSPQRQVLFDAVESALRTLTPHADRRDNLAWVQLQLVHSIEQLPTYQAVAEIPRNDYAAAIDRIDAIDAVMEKFGELIADIEKLDPVTKAALEARGSNPQELVVRLRTMEICVGRVGMLERDQIQTRAHGFLRPRRKLPNIKASNLARAAAIAFEEYTGCEAAYTTRESGKRTGKYISFLTKIFKLAHIDGDPAYFAKHARDEIRAVRGGSSPA